MTAKKTKADWVDTIRKLMTQAMDPRIDEEERRQFRKRAEKLMADHDIAPSEIFEAPVAAGIRHRRPAGGDLTG